MRTLYSLVLVRFEFVKQKSDILVQDHHVDVQAPGSQCVGWTRGPTPTGARPSAAGLRWPVMGSASVWAILGFISLLSGLLTIY